MSIVEFIPVIKELGAFGIALYALHVMNGLKDAVNNLTLAVGKCPINVEESRIS